MLSRLFLLIFCCCTLSSCSPTTTKLNASWHDPSYKGRAVKNVLVIGLTRDVLKKKAFEDSFSDRLREKGTEATSSYNVLPFNEEISKESVKSAIEGLGIDAVFLAQLVGTEKTKETVPGYTSTDYGYGSRNRSSNFYRYYREQAIVYHQPSYEIEIENVYIDSKMFDVESEKLIWQIQTKTINPSSFDKLLKQLSGKIIANLSKNNII